jgi:hypothetical protein
VETAVVAADGSPRGGTAQVSLPIAITVKGTPSAQIAIADVHRVDETSRHELAVVLRNYGNDATHVTGGVRVAGDNPQTLPFDVTVAGSRDTTLRIPWKAPAHGATTDLAVEVHYGDGDLASWSSTLGAPPTNLTPSADAETVATTVPDSTGIAAMRQSISQPSKPWWKKSFVPVGVIVAVFLAAMWFALEIRRSRQRSNKTRSPQQLFVAAANSEPGSSDVTVELAKQLVALSDVIVRLMSPTDDVAKAPRRGQESHDFETQPPSSVRPEISKPDDLEPVCEPAAMSSDMASTDATAWAASHPDSQSGPDAKIDPRERAMRRLLELDRERRRLRKWMDIEDAETAMYLPHPTDEERA